MSLTSKQRAALRGAANTMDPVYQIGKGEIDETLIQEIADCIADCIFDFAGKKDDIAKRVADLTAKFPLYE